MKSTDNQYKTLALMLESFEKALPENVREANARSFETVITLIKMKENNADHFPGATETVWHKVSEVLPEEGQLVLISNPAIQFAIFKKVFSPVIRVGRRFEAAEDRLFVGVDCWMPIPEILG